MRKGFGLTHDQLARAASIACLAADAARKETLARFRSVEVEVKADGSPVTEADRAAERAIRRVLKTAHPDWGLLGEEYGQEDMAPDRPHWVIDPIDGTICYSRGVPLYSTLIALVADGEPVVGLIDLPALDERYVGHVGAPTTRNGQRVLVSQEKDLGRAIISHGDPFCFDRAGQRAAFTRMAAEIPMLRGYTDAFGHAQVLAGGVGAMVDFDLNPWDAAATQCLVAGAGGVCRVHAQGNGRLGLVFGSPSLVEQLEAFLVA